MVLLFFISICHLLSLWTLLILSLLATVTNQSANAQLRKGSWALLVIQLRTVFLFTFTLIVIKAGFNFRQHNNFTQEFVATALENF
jgi:hypothetical protein